MPLRAILDTSAGPNLIREEVLTEYWERYRIADAPAYKIVGAGGRRLNQKGFVTLFVKLGILRTKARFFVVAGLAADCFLGCQFIDLHVKNILPREKRVTLMDDSLVSILKDSEELPETRKEEPKVPPVTKIRVAKFTLVPARAESTVWVQCAAPGLRFLKPSKVTHWAPIWRMGLLRFCQCSRSRSGWLLHLIESGSSIRV
jgi:hypothetical protein